MNPAGRLGGGSTVRFSGTLQAGDGVRGAGAGAVLAVPKGAAAKLPGRGTTMVEGIINAFPFAAMVEAAGGGGARLRLNQPLLKAARAEPGDVVPVEITRVGDEPVTRMPADLRKALTANPRARASWANVSILARRDWILSIGTTKNEDTRARRILVACDKLAKGQGRVCCFPGLNWITKDCPASVERWRPLPKAGSRGALPRAGRAVVGGMGGVYST
ncbi:MAG: YdeI/OmpD-associated family protein [bacterium]